MALLTADLIQLTGQMTLPTAVFNTANSKNDLTDSRF
jgi:hypothetical protein